ncbi:hypothetical protein Tco_0391496, partial [Tanacetum coccineum]
METKGKYVKRKLLYECASECHSMGVSKKQNVNFDVDTSVMTVDNGIPKPLVIQQRVQPEPLDMVVTNVLENDLVNRQHVDIHGKVNSNSHTMNPALSICAQGADTSA